MSRKKPRKVKSSQEIYKQPNNKIFIRPKLEPKTKAQSEYIRAIAEHDIVFCGGPAGTGKAQPLFCKVLTPNGFEELKNIKVGSVILTPNNKKTKVIAEFPQGKKDVYKVTFHDGTYTLCCKEHLWKIRSNSEENSAWPKIWNLEKIKNNLDKGRKGYYIECVQPIEFDNKIYDIDPYTMGVLLGDGCFKSSMTTLTCSDKFIIKKIRKNNPNNKIKKYSSKYTYGISNFTKLLKKENLFMKGSSEKFIPKKYMVGSINQRLELLRGLMDTDGTVCKRDGSSIYYTVSKSLKDGVVELVNSLGGICKVSTKIPTYKHNGIKLKGQKCYIIHINLNEFCPFSLPRKVKKNKKRVKYFPRKLFKSIEYFGQEESKCIMVDDNEHMYVTDNYICTHNSHVSVVYGLLKVLEGEYDKLVLIRPAITSEEIGLLPGDINEKINPLMEAVFDILGKFLTKEELISLEKDGKIVIKSVAYLRGITLDDSFIIVDEAQNCDKKKLMLIISRIGQNSKMVIEGDEAQSDLKKSDTLAFSKHLDIFENYCNQIGVFRFTEADIIRNRIIGIYLKAIKDNYGTDYSNNKQLN